MSHVTRTIAGVVICGAMLASEATAQVPLATFVKQRGFKARLNPGSFSLVGDVYPDKDKVGFGRIFRFGECFPDMTLDAPEALENHSDVVNLGVSNLSILLNLVKPAAGDLEKVKAELGAKRVQFVSMSATDLVHVGLSTGVIAQKAKGSLCEAPLLTQRRYLVADAIGANTLSYEFLDDRRMNVNAGLSAITGLLFNLGLSRSRTTIGAAEFSHPVFIGFNVVQWDGKGTFLNR